MSLDQIDHIVVVMMENRSFDHMLGYLSLDGPRRLAVDGLSSDRAWQDAHANLYGGTAYKSERLPPTVQAIDDPPHNRIAIDVQINTPALGGRRMGGFVSTYAAGSEGVSADPGRVMGYYDKASVPVFDFFARNFVVCDHWFSALPAGTQPNRLMAMAGESKIADNSDLLLPDQRLVYDWLADNQVDWCCYQWGGFFPFFSLNPRLLPTIVHSLTFKPKSGKFRRYENFAQSWASAKSMPQVIFIEPEYSDGPHCDPNDDHPPTGVAKGQAFLADIYTSLISNPARWARTMLIVTYDEHGGFFDHVPPLNIPATAGEHTFTTTGVRVPAFVISPQTKAGAVYRGQLDHTSVLQLLAERFTPGHGYSLAVNARHAHLHRLSDVLTPAAAAPRAPQISHAVKSGTRALGASAPLAPKVGLSPADPPNAQALHRALAKAVVDHPEMLRQPEWETVRRYVQSPVTVSDVGYR